MMTNTWPSPGNEPRDTGREVGHLGPPRDSGYRDAVAMAYRTASSEIPDDLLRLLAKLD